MRQCQQAQHGINCLLELCFPHVYFSSSLDHLILYERLIYKTSSCLSHEYVFSCIVCWWPHSINKLGWCCSPCSAFRMKEEGGEWVSHRIHSPPRYPALLSLTGFFPLSTPRYITLEHGRPWIFNKASTVYCYAAKISAVPSACERTLISLLQYRPA